MELHLWHDVMFSASGESDHCRCISAPGSSLSRCCFMVCFVLFAAVHRVPNPALQACAAQQLLRVAPVEDWLLYSRTPVNVCSAQQTSRCHVAAVGVLKLCVCVTCCWQEKLPASRAVPYRLCPLGVKCEGAVSMYNITICSGVVVRSLCAHIGRIPGCGKWSEWCGGRHKF